MNLSPFTKTLFKIFVTGFYRVHSGLLMMAAFVLFGLVEPGQWLSYEKTLMLAFISSPILMAVVFIAWLLYAIKATVYISGQLSSVNQQFLFYSSNAFNKATQFQSWLVVQAVVMLPLIIYGAISVYAAIYYRFYIAAFAISLYLFILTAGSAILYLKQVNRLVDGSRQSFILKITSRWQKPFFSLFIYHVFDKLKVNYFLAKILSLIIVTLVFHWFADVQRDVRVAGIAILGIITAHIIIIYQSHSFQNAYLSFARNLPYSRLSRFVNFIAVYLFLLLPECVWLFYRFNPATAVQLILLGLSFIMLFHSLIYAIGLNMDKYLQWILGLFVVLFWVIMFKILITLVCFNMAIAYWIFYRKYYTKY